MKKHRNTNLKPVSEIEEESAMLEEIEKKEAMEFSLAEKRILISKLKARGLTPKHFDMDWTRIKSFLQNH